MTVVQNKICAYVAKKTQLSINFSKISYYEIKKYTEAEMHFKKAIEINPKHGFAWNNLCLLYTSDAADE